MVQARGFAGNHTVNGQMLQRKCGCGSQGGKCACRKSDERTKFRGLQTKIAVSEASDKFEQEADRVAEQVLAAPVHASVETTPLRIQRVASQTSGSRDTAPSSVDHVLSGSGRPLGPTLQGRMEQRFGYDFSSVRVHTGAAAETSARDVNAQAYTVGNNIVFGAGRFAPTTHEGQRLIAHELTHVVQQSGTGASTISTKLQRKVVDDDEHLPCRKTEKRTAKDATDIENEAARLAENAASSLRKRPVETREVLWNRFRLDFNDSAVRCRFLPELAERFDRIAASIRNTPVKYGCTDSGEEPIDLCRGINSDHFAYTQTGAFVEDKIFLCSRFWRAPFKEQAATILHEWVHYIFDWHGVTDEPTGGFDTAECYSNFAVEVDGGKVIVYADIKECLPNPKKLPKLDQARVGLSCGLNLFPNISALTGLQTGVPGAARFSGLGLDALLPVTRMHEWELDLGARFRQYGDLTNPDDWTAYAVAAHVGLALRRQPWRRFSKQAGLYLEGGVLNVERPDSEQKHPFASIGGSAGINFRLNRESHTAFQILADASVGKAFDFNNERGFKFFQLGLSFGITWE